MHRMHYKPPRANTLCLALSKHTPIAVASTTNANSNLAAIVFVFVVVGPHVVMVVNR